MFIYCLKSGFNNLGTKKLFTAASIGTIACCCLIFSIFFSLMKNITQMIHTIETTIGIQVFFEPYLSEDDIVELANTSLKTNDVKSMKFISSNEAWDYFKKEYFEGKEELANAFEDDNPLAKSASYEIILNDINKQREYINNIKSIEGIRQINYSRGMIDILLSFNKYIAYFSITLIGILVVIAIILISSTITVASQFRKNENEIMKLIGATNYMIRAPFVFEGAIIGFIGAIIPLVLVGVLYNYLIQIFMTRNTVFSKIFTPVPFSNIFFSLSGLCITTSILLCMLVSSITISKHLKV